MIIALPHLGGWEWAGRWIADRGHPITVVVERIEPPELFDWFAELRSSLGMTVVPLGPDAGTAVMRALRDNHIVCLVSDRDLAGDGPEVEFFGERTTLPGGPPRSPCAPARRSCPRASTSPIGSTDTTPGSGRRSSSNGARSGCATTSTRVTQDLAAELEILIRRAPFQWHLFQPNWPSDPGYGS